MIKTSLQKFGLGRQASAPTDDDIGDSQIRVRSQLLEGCEANLFRSLVSALQGEAIVFGEPA